MIISEMMNTYETMLQALKSAGYRITSQRKAICRVLAESDEHPSAQMIFEQIRKQDDTLSLATVYNTLDALTHLGVVNVLGEVGDRDSIRYDGDITPHVNLACVRCHRIIDIPSQFVHDLECEVEQNSGYALMGARVLYYGLCPDCQASGGKETSDHPNHSAAETKDA
jgi:Fur family peroxide stress response transcriptional regulator